MAIDANDIFAYGSRWLRADFHLYTKVDKEFSYSDNENYYLSNYVDALESAEIGIGVITNHNKFDCNEFKALRKTAKNKRIFLLPGVELFVNDGANGIHTLIVFSDEWVAGEQDYITPFISSMFPGKTPQQYENGNFRSDKNILQVIAELEKVSRDYFLIFAHVEEPKGLWEEMKGGKLTDWQDDRYHQVRDKTLGFQKVRTRNLKSKVQSWLGDFYPAEVEGSDCKSIDEIGRGKPCYLKIGDFTFKAVKYALLDCVNRIAEKPKRHTGSYIKNISFDGGVLDGKTIRYSAELNTLIGIRGSGKSSILEALRYVLDIPFGDKALDKTYKESLVDHVLGSGGKATIHAVDRLGREYEIRRINREMPDVYVDGKLQPGVSIRETILHKPVYFGQKDLSATGEGFEKDLVEKLVGENLAGTRSRIEEQRQKVFDAVERLKKLSSAEEKKKECQAKKQDAEFRLKVYKDYGIEERLQKQVDFDTDSRKIGRVIAFVKSYLDDLESFISQHEDDLKNQRVYTSKQNRKFFDEFFGSYDKLIATFDNNIRQALVQGQQVLTDLRAKTEEFERLKDSLKEGFAEVERKLAEQLKSSGVEAIRPDEFRRLRQIVEQTVQMLKALDMQEHERENLDQELLSELAALNDLWREEYKAIQDELAKVNQGRHSALQIKAEFKADKAAFVTFMKDLFRGSRIRETTFQQLAESFSDFGTMYKEFNRAKDEVGVSLSSTFDEYFMKNLSALLTWQVPNRFTIEYRGKELKHHSLGQRASALILFVLSQQENDVFIIDQPEDDLDNQTIYEDVIKLICVLKPRNQFIFATHNANFPVLGDAEQVISCAYSDDSISVNSGSIDRQKLQQEIVDIMEGGEEAFEQRKRRYEIWKPQKF